MPIPLLTVDLRHEADIVLARLRTRQVAERLGYDALDQTRWATAVSELARNAFEYAGGGHVEFMVDEPSASPRRMIVTVRDEGPGIPNLQAVLDGSYRSPHGMGAGLLGARRLSERFTIDSAPGRGTRVVIDRRLPPRAGPFTADDAARLAEFVMRQEAASPIGELQAQNRELARALDLLQTRTADVERLNAELEETNRGVVALYAELDDRAKDLKQLSETKSRFLSDVGHELRTPLASIANLSRLLLDRVDGDLTPEQEHQLTLIRRSADSVIELVNDLLDLAKIESGIVTLRPTEFTVAEVFAALRGMFRPLVPSESVVLVFDEPTGLPSLHTDEGRLSQILRNFISNALKFTERGEVRVRADVVGDGAIRFLVRDTGIGIAPEDQEHIFREFTQVEHRLQKRAKGTGLGLPLSRRLAELLGGEITMESTPGEGSTFAVTIPTTAPEANGRAVPADRATPRMSA
ncbi:MAG TPA: sensor histidine kinase [Gemmatimonadaceae bacterium]|nr:sensor histidine kinase [Gemmatimonadaceae bacterium]